jgi:hypothetical protein
MKFRVIPFKIKSNCAPPPKGEESPKVFLTPFNCAPKSPKGDFKEDTILYI